MQTDRDPVAFGRSLHVALAALLGCLSTADLALTVGAGGARVSLPLVLFAVSECGYVPPAVSPQKHVQLLSGSSFEQIFQILPDPFGTCWASLALIYKTFLALVNL